MVRCASSTLPVVARSGRHLRGPPHLPPGRCRAQTSLSQAPLSQAPRQSVYSCDFMGTGLRCGRLRSPRKQPRLAEVRGAGDLNLYSDVAAADLHPSIVFCSQQPLSTADPGIFEGCPHSQGGVGDGEAKVKVRGLPRTLLALAGQAPPPFITFNASSIQKCMLRPGHGRELAADS